MIEGRPSATAMRVAMQRAVHQRFDTPVVFQDELAQLILGSQSDELSIEDYLTLPGTRLRAFLVARSRFAEDKLKEARAVGITQYVVLGAGLDTFAYRNPYADLKVFEIDFPATQVWKRSCLETAGIAIPDSVIYVPIDFAKQSLNDELKKSGFLLGEPTFFSWLGVTPYLKRDTVLSTLSAIYSFCAQNSVVFDYTVPRELLDSEAQRSFDALAARVARAGEPFTCFFDPVALRHELKEIGFKTIEDLGPVEIDSLYFENRSDQLRVALGAGRIVCARGPT